LNTEDAFSDDTKDIPAENTILDYISPDTLIIINEPQIALNEIHEIRERLSGHNIIYTTSFLTTGHIEEADKSELKIDFASKPQPDIRSNLKILYGSISEYIEKDFDIEILCSDEYQCKRIKTLLEDFEDDNVLSKDMEIHHEEKPTNNAPATISIKDKFTVIPESVQSGFIYENAKLAVFTEHQIFGRYFKQYKKRSKKFKGLTLTQLKELQIGDYIVHRDFGIGIDRKSVV